MSKNELTREFKGNFSELRKIINSWDLIPGSPNDEFDYLNHKILSQLYKNPESKKINNILQSELTVYYGLFKNEFDATNLVSEIIEWWNLKKWATDTNFPKEKNEDNFSQRKLAKTEMLLISSFTVRETKRFLMFKTVDKNGNADNKGLASMLAEE